MRRLIVGVALFAICYLRLQINADELLDHCKRQSSWGPWRCPGSFDKCSEDLATRYKCPEGDCVEGSQCTFLEGFKQTKDCVKALNKDECRPYWGSWTAWSACTATCGVSERQRYRSCNGAYSSTTSAEDLKDTCADISRAEEGMERRDCPLQRICPRIAGGWGEWGEFSVCDATCGRGHRRRIRLCNKPFPQGGGVPCQGLDTQLVECDAGVPCPTDGAWCPWSSTVIKCSEPCGDSGMGLRTRRCNCPAPAHGGKPCALTPGTKEAAEIMHTQLKQALERNETAELSSLPTLADIAAIADGSGKWDACNRKFCPYLKRLTEEETKLIVNDLRQQHPETIWLWSSGKPVSRFEPIGLHCSSDLRSRIEIFDKRYRFPRGHSFWTLTPSKSARQRYDFVGTPVVDNRRLQITEDRLIIRGLDEPDEGVYRFGYEYEPGQFATICFFAVYLPDKNREVESEKPFTFSCNALALWPVIQQTPNDNWRTYWSYQPDEKAKMLGMRPKSEMWLSILRVSGFSDGDSDGTENRENNFTELTLFDTEKRRIDEVKYSMSGYYKCIVESKPEGLAARKFITNAIKLSVISPPTLNERFLRWFRENWKGIVGLLTALGILVIIYMISVKIRAGQIASLKILAAEEAAKKRTKLVTAGEIEMKTT